MILFLTVAITLALAIPHPVTKQILMGVLGIFVGVLFLTNVRLALCLLPLLIPAQTLAPEGLIPIPGVNIETLLIGLMLVAWQMQRGKFEPKRPAEPMPAFVAILITFLAWLFLAALRTAFEGSMGLGELITLFKNQWIYIAVLFVVADSLRDERDRIRLMVAVCIGIILVSIQPISHGTEMLARGQSLERHRAISIMALQANAYGGALACFAPFPLIYVARGIGGKKGRILFGLATGVAIYALVLTLSRGSWLAFAAAIAVIGVLFERRILYILAVGALLSPFWIPEDALNRGSSISEIDFGSEEFEDEEVSTFVRVDQWSTIPAALSDAPILGHGYQSFPDVYAQLGSLGRAKGAHVGYADYAVEAGAPGLALYVAIFAALGFFGLRLARQGASVFSRSQGIGLLGAAIAMLVAEGFGSRLKVGSVTAFLWMYAGVAIAAWRWPAKAPGGPATPTDVDENRGLVRRGDRARGAATRPSAAPARSPGPGRKRTLREDREPR